MLKIIDNVDLKELEKYGFEKNIAGGYELPICRCEVHGILYSEHILEVTYQKILIIVTKIKDNHLASTNTSQLDILYDLIQAGLVEKV